MFSPLDPLATAGAWLRFTNAFTQMQMSAAEVIVRRTIKMAQGSMTPGEAVAMVLEKATAFVAATESAAAAAAAGRDPIRIASAALHPIRIKTRSNVRELRG